MAKRPTQDRDDQPTATTPNETITTSGPRELPLVALRETVIFPEMIVPLQVGRDKSVQALNKAVADSSPIVLVTQRRSNEALYRELNDKAGIAVLLNELGCSAWAQAGSARNTTLTTIRIPPTPSASISWRTQSS